MSSYFNQLGYHYGSNHDSMQILISDKTLSNWSGNTLGVGIFKKGSDKVRKELHKRFSNNIKENSLILKFSARRGEILSLGCFESTPQKLILIGLGESSTFNIQSLRNAASAIAMKGNGDKLGVYFPIEGLDLTSAITAIGEALRLSLYRDHRFRSTAQYINFSEGIDIIGTSHSLSANLTKIWSTCSGVELSRQLVAAPAKIITPQALADTATNIARDFNLDIKILEREECQALGMGSYLAVGQGSSLPPKFIHITYTPKGLINRRVAIVGKGVTFDSGGYNLKVGASKIEMMKYDMGGSAAILGTARSIAELQPVGVEVHMIIAACENMISGSAIHPGDIVVASNGKTIEITNTDAEGRLTLADALVYACHLKPDSIVDIATLTGASVIALGEEIAGLWSTSDHLAAELVQAGEQGGELLWRMPLHYPYRKGMRSLMADMKNTASRAGSSITAALFLKEFISPGIEWAHIDMAGTVWSEKGRNQDPPGATGFGVRTLVNWICSSNQAD